MGFFLRVGRKASLAEVMKVGKQRISRYLQPLENKYVKADIRQHGNTISYTLTPDTIAKRYLGELGIAWLLPKEADRVQWIGQGPYPSYPGRERANRYGLWAMQQGDLYFEGNRMGIEACWLSDKEGNGVLITAPCDNDGNIEPLMVNFEQTDQGIVVSVNAAVSGMCPKFGSSPFGVWSNKTAPQSGSFQLYETKASNPSPLTSNLFLPPSEIPAPFKPFHTQYDTYLMKLEDVSGY